VTTLLLLGPVLLVAAGLGVALLELLIRRADVAAALVFLAVLDDAWFVKRVPALVLPGGVQLYVTDLVSGLLVGAGVLRLLRRRHFHRFHRWALLLALLFVVSLARGVAAFGMQPAIADFREYMMFVGGALYFASFPVSSELYDRIGRIWLAMTVPMMILVCLRWLAVFAGINLGVPASNYGADAAIRVIDGPFTFFLACAFVLTIPGWFRGAPKRWIRWVSVLLLVFVLVLNRRTVWLAIAVGVAVLMLRDRHLGRRAAALVAVGAFLTVTAYVLLGGLKEGNQPVEKSGSGTLSWRLQGWSDLLGPWAHRPGDWLIGQPVGSGFDRTIDGILVNTHPHDFYIEILLRTGFAGLAALLALTFGLLRALWRTPARDTGLLGPGVIPALLAMQIVWFLTWVPGSEQCIVTGLAVAVAAGPVSRRYRPPPRPALAAAGRELPPYRSGAP
jgi:hypothetical protein